jgi:hypothetical protein
VRYPLKDALGLDLVPHCALIALRSPVTLRRWYSNERTTSSLYYSGDTGTNRGTSLRRPFDARRRAQIRSNVLHQAAEDLAAEEQAQVKRRDPLYRDIISNLTMTSYTRDAFTARYLNRRGNRSVPKKYLKTAQWALIDNEEGYYCHYSGFYYPIEFNYDHGYWSQIEYRPQNSTWLSWKATPTEWGLDIETDEFTTRNDWGLLDGEDDPDTDGGLSDTANRFQDLKLDVAGPEDIDVKIATTEREQQAEDCLGEIIKNLTVRPKSRAGTSQYLAPSITAMMSTTMTQNQPTSTYVRRTGGNPPGGGPPPGGGFFSGGFRPLGGGPPGGGGGGPPGGNPEGNQTAAQNQGHGGGGGKLQGKEPRIFAGDKNQSEEFQLEWDIYVALNHNVDVIQIAFTHAVMFLSYIKGASVHEWVQSRVRWLAEQLTGGALQNDEYLYQETHTAFQNAFTDTMTMQKAKNEIQNLKMKDGDVDGYTARFEQLCRLGNYDVNDEAVLDMYRRGLYPKLQVNIIQNERPFTYQEWVRGAQRQQQIYLQVRSILGERPNQGKPPNNQNQNRTQEQWRNAFSKNNSRKDPNAMDTSADRIQARQITTDE